MIFSTDLEVGSSLDYGTEFDSVGLRSGSYNDGKKVKEIEGICKREINMKANGI